ncbi:hypothetical protein [Desulfitobacterium sp. AusDCA]|uniref:hypothetical protein n=1 Tax=Desulfitobacterium sp. AusDCA TaxID=3240383 RepID=UPI003DA709E1
MFIQKRQYEGNTFGKEIEIFKKIGITTVEQDDCDYLQTKELLKGWTNDQLLNASNYLHEKEVAFENDWMLSDVMDLVDGEYESRYFLPSELTIKEPLS